MAFRYNGETAGISQKMRYKTLPIKDGDAFTFGRVGKIVDGRWAVAATSDTIDGIFYEPDGKTGDTAGTVTGHFILVKGCEFEVGQNSLSDASTDEGSSLDIASGGLLPAADSNHDLRVTRRDLARDLLYVVFLKPGI